MVRRSFLTIAVCLAGLGLVFSSFTASAQDDSNKRGRKYKAPPPTARLEITILNDVNGKPIENSAVIFHPMAGEKDEGNMELKTNEDGKTVIDVLPIGDTVRLQVVAHGFQTFGQDYKIDKPEMGIEVRLLRPGAQYSIYHKGSGVISGGKSTVTDPATPNAPAKPADPPATQPAPQASQPQPQ